MGLFDGSNDPSQDPSQGNGLMNLYANPQTAGMMGLAQGLLAASGPSRLPVTMGQALGNGMQGFQQNAGNALALQRQMMQMRALNGLMGMGGQPQQQPQPQSQQPDPTMAQGAPISGGGNVGSLSGVSAGLGSMAPQLPPAQTQAPTAPSGPSIMGRTPAQLWQQGMLMNYAGIPGGSELMSEALKYDPTLAAQMPTDITKMGVQGGMTPQQIQQANAAGVTKANYIAPVRAAPGGALAMPDGTMRYTLPAPQAGGMWATNPDGSLLLNQAGQPYQIGVGGASNIAGGMAFAKTAGEGSALPYDKGVDAQGNPLPVTNRTAAATQGNAAAAPTLSGIFTQQESSGGRTAPDNPLQIQQGTFNQYAQSGESWSNPSDRSAVAQRVLTNYNQKYNGDLGRIATAYFSGEGNVAPANSPTPFIKNTADANGKTVASYVGDILGRAGGSGFGGSAPAAGNGPQGAAPAPAKSGGPIYAAPPMGATTAANASQGAPSKQMADSYGSLSNADGGYQQSREAILEMLNLANNKGVVGSAVGILPQGVSTRVSPDAATYQKLHATYVALQGKALGSGGTDASRATIDEAVPTYDKPQSAMVNGLTTQLNNLDLSHIKTQFLTPIYQQGDEKQFTQQSAAFDQNIKPAMIPVLRLNGDAQRAAVQSAVKANPALRSSYEWAFNNGLLK
jgi:hypothetical protein